MNNQTFLTEEIKEYLYGVKDYYQLTNYEYINLITLILTHNIITNTSVMLEDINYFTLLILNNRNNKIINNNSSVYNGSIKYIITNYYKQYGINENSFYTIMNNWFNGYYFHSLNNSFISEINSSGLVLENKPWDIRDIQTIKKIFKGKRDVFGMSNGEDNIIFLATNLMSSPYYGLTSPTFFRKFIEHEPKYLNTYLKRDSKQALDSITELCTKYNLNSDECLTVSNFFYKYWDMYATDELPSIILIKRPLQSNIPYPTTDIVNHTISSIIKDNHTKIIRKNIKRHDLIIFDCNSLDIIKQSQKKLN